jgi:hypothetical protein
VNLIDRIDAFRERHPEVKIKLAAGKDTWEVREPDRPRTLHPWPASMMDDLEARYDNPTQTTQQQANSDS